jgi:hypothetical protein
MTGVSALPRRTEEKTTRPRPGWVELFAAADVPEDVRDAWEQARAASPHPHGHDRIDWLVLTAEYDTGDQPGIAVLRDADGAFVGGLPFHDKRHTIRWRIRMPGRAVTVLRSEVPVTHVSCEAVIGSDDPVVAETLVQAICRARRDRGKVSFAQARIGTGLEAALRRLGRRPEVGWWRAPFPIDTFRLQGRMGDDFDAFFDSRVSAKARADLRRRQRRHLEQPGASLTLVDRPEQVDDFVDDAVRILEASWHGEHGASIPARRRKHELRWWAERGELHSWLYADDSGPVAFQIGRIVDGTQWFDLIAYRGDRGKDSPGEMLMYSSLRVGHERGARRVDWGYGVQPYKLRWANDSLTTRDYTFVRTRPGPLLCALPPLQYRWARGIAVRALGEHGLAEPLREFSNRRLHR